MLPGLAGCIGGLAPAGKVFRFLSTQTTTTNVPPTGSPVTVFTGVDIGEPDVNRLVIVAQLMAGQLCSLKIGGTSVTTVNSAGNTRISYVNLTTGTTANFEYTNHGDDSCGQIHCSVYVAYPTTATPLDNAIATGTGALTLSNLEVAVGGFAVWVAGKDEELGTYTSSWNGVDSPVEDYDGQLESASSATQGHVGTTEASTVRDLTITPSVTNQSGGAVAASWGA